jgi:hypothetical protein
MMDARTLTMALGGEWGAGSGNAPCPVCQPERRRDQRGLSISDRGGKLLLHCHKLGCAFPDIARSAGITRRDMARPHPAPDIVRVDEAAKREQQARMIWDGATPIQGTVAETYLRGRGITAPLAPTLRFHPDCWHHRSRQHLPAMVGLIEGAGGFGIHRTYLRPDSKGKATVDPAKAMLGTCSGGAVRLSSGPGPLVVCEGIETGLSLLSGLLAGPATVWAALSTSGMRALHLPADPGALIIAADSDDGGAGHHAADALAERARGAGWGATLRPAPDGMDWNDALLRNRRA